MNFLSVFCMYLYSPNLLQEEGRKERSKREGKRRGEEKRKEKERKRKEGREEGRREGKKMEIRCVSQRCPPNLELGGF